MSAPRVRIAPSPTGNLHVGTARAALFNYLFAKHYNGTFILRIEDTDVRRSDKKYEQNIFKGLRWLGIDPDEGPEQGGPYGPYRQSERAATYGKYIRQLLEAGKAFYCFHTKEELESEKKEQMQNKLPARHVCEHKAFSREEIEQKKVSGRESIIRFDVSTYQDPGPHNPQITFQDIIRDQVHFFTRLLGDFSIAKSLDVPLYNFAVVIDDYEMKITHVIRGEDHIPNTPKQLLIAWALGWTQKSTDGVGDLQAPWTYAHLPLILGPDRSKLSKRHGATSVDEYRSQGYLPEALFNFMALLGWSPGDDREILPKKDLIEAFSLMHMQHSGAIFDTTKLDWMNSEYIKKLTTKQFFNDSGGFFPPEHTDYDERYNLSVSAVEQPRLKKLSDIGERTGYFYRQPEYERELLRWKNTSDAEILNSLRRSEDILAKLDSSSSKEAIEKAFLDEIGERDKGPLLWPLRVALSGKKASPGPFEIMAILGIDESRNRINAAQKLI
ncbi:MAG: glutamate--tRNA ligase [Candidatus Sungbacteria bacterium]|nr:glutamate--tRNA ligase [Candidatus Sungbacteria bacterium]